jgi:Fur family transcriptional regulator, ferric uptake regulator
MQRSTRQRNAITSVMQEAKRPLSVQEVLRGARAAIPSMGVATVYRTLKVLVENGGLQVVVVPGADNRYELPASRHHHHFLCKLCDRVYELVDCPGSLAHLAPRGFTVDDHDITLYGRCPDCKSQRRRRRRSPTPAHA